jgi:mttA/Hcf106 family
MENEKVSRKVHLSLVIAVIVLVFLVWGPNKIPELARSLGPARARPFGAGHSGRDDSTACVFQTRDERGEAARAIERINIGVHVWRA